MPRSSPEQSIIAGLVAAGLPRNSIAAILGRIRQESNFQPLGDQDFTRGGSHGLFNVSNNVWRDWLRFARDRGLSATDAPGQARFMVTYFQRVAPEAYRQFVNAETPTQAARAWREWNFGGNFRGNDDTYAEQYASTMPAFSAAGNLVDPLPETLPPVNNPNLGWAGGPIETYHGLLSYQPSTGFQELPSHYYDDSAFINFNSDPSRAGVVSPSLFGNSDPFVNFGDPSGSGMASPNLFPDGEYTPSTGFDELPANEYYPETQGFDELPPNQYDETSPTELQSPWDNYNENPVEPRQEGRTEAEPIRREIRRAIPTVGSITEHNAVIGSVANPLFGIGAVTGQHYYNPGTGWVPIGQAPQNIRSAQNSGTGNYTIEQTASHVPSNAFDTMAPNQYQPDENDSTHRGGSMIPGLSQITQGMGAPQLTTNPENFAAYQAWIEANGLSNNTLGLDTPQSTIDWLNEHGFSGMVPGATPLPDESIPVVPPDPGG